MTRKALAAIFGWCGPFVLVLSIAVLALTQGGPLVGGLQGLDAKSTITSAYFATFIIGAALGLAGAAVAMHARLPRKRTESALPLIGLGDAAQETNASAMAVRFYAGGVLVVFVLFPAFVLGHASRKVAKYGQVWNEQMPANATIDVGCLLPSLWPFGACADKGARVAAYLEKTKKQPLRAAKLWLSGKACDFVAYREMTGSQANARRNSVPPGRVLTETEERARELASDARDIDFSAGEGHDDCCADPRDLSPACKEDRDQCRGVQWEPVLSPALIIFFTLLGWASAIWAVFAVLRGPEKWET